MKTTNDLLTSEFGKIHAKFRTISTRHVPELKEDVMQWKIQGLITESFHDQYYSFFQFAHQEKFPSQKSIVVIAVPQKIQPIDFIIRGKQHQVIIPPTYVYTKMRKTCMDILTKVLSKTNHSVTRAMLPMKLLAVCSGLGKYGKNNICYVDGMGSFVRLEAFYTDFEFPTDDWREKEMMPACKDCSLCQKACPTQCIPTDQFLVHADHCLTYLNENIGEFPSWLDPRSHNALVGCMRCQLVCPQNRSVIHLKQEQFNFTEEETMVLLKSPPRVQLPKNLVDKLTKLDMTEYYEVLPRNLAVLLDKK